MLSVNMRSVTFSYGEWCYAECHYAECHYAECRSTGCRGHLIPLFLSELSLLKQKVIFMNRVNPSIDSRNIKEEFGTGKETLIDQSMNSVTNMLSSHL